MLNIFKNPYIFIVFLHDLMVIAGSFLLALSLRFEVFDPSSLPVKNLQVIFPLCLLVQAICLHFSGLYKGVWKFSSVPDLSRVIKGCTLAVPCSLVSIFLYSRLETIPRSIFFIDWILLIMGLGGSRFCYRLWKDNTPPKWPFFKRPSPDQMSNILVVGARNHGIQLIKEITSNPETALKVVGLIDDNPLLKGRTIMGIKVLGNREDIGKLVNKYQIQQVFITTPSNSGKQIREIIQQCKKSRVLFKMLPPLSKTFNNKVGISLLQNVKLEDLLRRGPAQLDIGSIEKMIEGKTIMVTGAGGSIGTELCRQIALFKPKRLICFEISEFFLYQLELKLRESSPHLDFVPLIGDIRNHSRVAMAFDRYRPEVVLHTAAYKHVPMMEMNPMEAIDTNVKGTLIVAEQAKNYNAKKFVMVSTDKAVNPSSIMGHSKRVAEMICQHMGALTEKTDYIIVRFGNVMGSNGSIIPLFKSQIENRSDVTVTHPEMERYFMSISEASKLVLQASSMGKGGDVLVLNMGLPIKIVDLAKEMITLAGLELGKDIEIKFIGPRRGEKLCEELFSNEESLAQTAHKKILGAKMQKLPPHFEKFLSELTQLNADTERPIIIEKLKRLVGTSSLKRSEPFSKTPSRDISKNEENIQTFSNNSHL